MKILHYILLMFSIIILLFIIFYPVSPPTSKLYIFSHKAELYAKPHKIQQTNQKSPAKYPGAAVKYKELNSEYLQIKEKPVQYNPLNFDNGKISVEILPWCEVTEKDAALGIQFKFAF